MTNPLARGSALLLILTALTPAASAQRDRIVFKDGTVVESATVSSFDLRNIEYRVGGRAEQRPSDRVEELRIERVHDAYRLAYAEANSPAGPATFLTAAERQSNAFLKQFGYYEAAQLFLESGQFGEAFQCLEDLVENVPDSGFVPELHRTKIEYYLSRGKAGAADAQSVAKEYETASLTRGYPSGCQYEAKYYLIRAAAAAGDIDAQEVESQMQSLASSASSVTYVADRARLAVADARRAQGRLDEAAEIYEDLLESDRTTAKARAGAWLGMGHTHHAAGNPGNTAVYRQALLAFLRVYLETPDVSPAMTAEALYFAAEAAKKWGGPDSRRISGILGARLRRNYPESEWANR